MQTVVIYSTRSMNKSEPLDEHLIRGTCAVFSHKAWQMNNDTYLQFDDFNVLLLFFRHRHPARQTDRQAASCSTKDRSEYHIESFAA